MGVVVFIMRMRMEDGVRVRIAVGVYMLMIVGTVYGILGAPRVVALGRARQSGPWLRHGCKEPCTR